MTRNEYRRGFIMLRAVMQGYGGHVRLERRTLTGSLYFIVTAPQGVEAMQAALVGQRDGAYYAALVGPLARDRRGQLALAWAFDPRDIRGRPLEAYSWVAVVATGGPCAVALIGNVEGSRPVDPTALSRAVCALFPRDGDALPAADLPEAGEPEAAAPDDSAFVTRQTQFEPQNDGDVKIYTGSRSRQRQAKSQAGDTLPGLSGDASTNGDTQRRTGAAESRIESQTDSTLPDLSGDASTNGGTQRRTGAAESRIESQTDSALPDLAGDAPTNGGTQRRTDVENSQAEAQTGGTPFQNDAAQAEASDFSRPVTAARRLGLEITAPWPDAVEPLRRLFATQAPLNTPLGDGFVYISAPMPEGSGLGTGFVGLRAEDGQITAARYALPGRRAPLPPAGLEAYQWLPAVGEDGYWVLTSDLSRRYGAEGLGIRE